MSTLYVKDDVTFLTYIVAFFKGALAAIAVPVLLRFVAGLFGASITTEVEIFITGVVIGVLCAPSYTEVKNG